MTYQREISRPDTSLQRALTPTLCVAVIVKNEEEDLPGFLQSFSTIADEIVIIDDGSTDRTEAIARAFDGAVRFLSSPMAEHEGFCDQRNKAVAAARCDWVLQVDCDMRLTADLATEILRAIRGADFVAYRFRLRQYFLGHECRHGGLQYWNQAWLARRDAVRWTQKLHERIIIDGAESQIGQLTHRMVHLNDRDFAERLRKNFQYAHLEADRLLRSAPRLRLWHLVTKPLWRAFRSCVLMRGFLDGRIGFVWAFYQFTGTATAYFIAWDQANRTNRAELEQGLNRDLSRVFQQSVRGQ